MAIYDANNGTKATRKAVAEKFTAKGIHVVFLGKHLASVVVEVLISGTNRVDL